MSSSDLEFARSIAERLKAQKDSAKPASAGGGYVRFSFGASQPAARRAAPEPQTPDEPKAAPEETPAVAVEATPAVAVEETPAAETALVAAEEAPVVVAPEAPAEEPELAAAFERLIDGAAEEPAETDVSTQAVEVVSPEAEAQVVETVEAEAAVAETIEAEAQVVATVEPEAEAEAQVIETVEPEAEAEAEAQVVETVEPVVEAAPAAAVAESAQHAPALPELRLEGLPAFGPQAWDALLDWSLAAAGASEAFAMEGQGLPIAVRGTDEEARLGAIGTRAVMALAQAKLMGLAEEPPEQFDVYAGGKVLSVIAVDFGADQVITVGVVGARPVGPEARRKIGEVLHGWMGV